MIETDRLILTRPALPDLDESAAMLGDAAVMAYVGGKPLSREEAWNKLLRNIGHWTTFGYGLFTVRERESGRHVGETGIAHFGRGLGTTFDPYPEAAWMLAAGAQGRGYATEAVTAAHDWMMRTHRPPRTVCIINPANRPSLRVAARLGYVQFDKADYRDARPLMFERIARPSLDHAAASR